MDLTKSRLIEMIKEEMENVGLEPESDESPAEPQEEPEQTDIYDIYAGFTWFVKTVRAVQAESESSEEFEEEFWRLLKEFTDDFKEGLRKLGKEDMLR